MVVVQQVLDRIMDITPTVRRLAVHTAIDNMLARQHLDCKQWFLDQASSYAQSVIAVSSSTDQPCTHSKAPVLELTIGELVIRLLAAQHKWLTDR